MINAKDPRCQQGGKGSEGCGENQVGCLRKVQGAEDSERGTEVWKGCRNKGTESITVSVEISRKQGNMTSAGKISTKCI